MKMNWSFFIFALFWIAISATAAIVGNRHWYFVFCLTPGFLIFNAVRLMMLHRKKEWIAWCGLAATLIGDYCLVYQCYGRHELGFFGGVAGFSLAQIFFITYFALTGGFRRIVAIAGSIIAIAVLLIARHEISAALFAALTLYGILSATSLSGAIKSDTLSFPIGVGLLFISDITIALNWVLESDINIITSITYISALISFAFAIAQTGKSKKQPAEAMELEKCKC